MGPKPTVALPESPVAERSAVSSQPVRAALRSLPLLGEDPSGPLGSGLLASGALGATIRRLQAALLDGGRPEPST